MSKIPIEFWGDFQRGLRFELDPYKGYTVEVRIKHTRIYHSSSVYYEGALVMATPPAEFVVEFLLPDWAVEPMRKDMAVSDPVWLGFFSRGRDRITKAYEDYLLTKPAPDM